MRDFFAVMPADSGMAFVVVQHLEPTHESLMATILGKYTGMQVVQAEDGMLVQANCVYVNPAGRYISIKAERLVLSEQSGSDRIRMPIDVFLTSLAEEHHEETACIIFSGSSGADGTRGVQAIHAAGGLCMAQDPQTAQFGEMPQSAIDTGVLDFVLPADQLPAALMGFNRYTGSPSARAADSLPACEPDALKSILQLLRGHANIDYRNYKIATVERRIRRRMRIRRSASMNSYCELLHEDPEELEKLSKDMLISVSAFFRDPVAFEELREKVIVPMIAHRPADATLRVWVPGCATGEEAYSIAMLLMEAAESSGTTVQIQVFASDVDEVALGVARAGVYPESISNAVSAERLERFFKKQDGKYRIEKRLRDAVVFSRQDLLTDPPFSRIDLISCRNVLIYIEPAIQRKILALFGFALNPGGHLFLGKSEGISEFADLFEPISKNTRIFRLIGSGRRAVTAFPKLAGRRSGILPEPNRDPPSLAGILRQANQDVLLKHFNACVVLVDANGTALHFFGDTEKYLDHPKGLASLNLLDMTAGIVSVKLRRAMELVLKEGGPVAIPRVPTPREGNPLVNLTVVKASTGTDQGEILGIIFEDADDPNPRSLEVPALANDDPLVAQLESEVKALQNELRADAENFDAATEELKAANEEVMSMNEELQSAIEELEASKEELQAVNEELNTVNSQLGEKLAELTAINDDLANLLTATDIATVFLDSQLRIKRFTVKSTELLNLIPSDVGRPISHITQNFDGRELANESEKLLRGLAIIEKEVRTQDGRWHTMRIMPYRTLKNRVDGVVITFSDVTRLKQAEKAARELEGRVFHAQQLESLGVLAGGIAHDFNNILAGVLGYEELTLVELENKKSVDVDLIRSHVENAKQCTLRASELTAQMLAYSGRGVLELQVVDLNSIIQHMGALISASISKSVELEYRLASRLPGIEADASQITQVLLNLVINASEAIGEARGSITITTSVLRATRADLLSSFPQSDLPGGEYVHLEVRDTGCGMDAPTKAKIFQPFFSSKFVGRGLGLFVVAGIISRHHGAVAVDSTPGTGTTFRVILPACAPPAALREMESTESEESALPSEGRGMVLVIDDEPRVLEVTSAFLRNSGFTTLLARSGLEGVELFKARHAEIQMVLLDVTMPGMTAEQVLSGLQSIRKDVIVLLSSGYSPQEISTRFAGKGVSDFIAKPFSMKSLALKVAACLRKRNTI